MLNWVSNVFFYFLIRKQCSTWCLLFGKPLSPQSKPRINGHWWNRMTAFYSRCYFHQRCLIKQLVCSQCLLRLFRCESAVKLCGSAKRTAGLGPLCGNHMQEVTTIAHCGSTQLNTTISLAISKLTSRSSSSVNLHAVPTEARRSICYSKSWIFFFNEAQRWCKVTWAEWC